MGCCGQARVRAKRIAVKKATKRAEHLNKIGKLPQPKKATLKKGKPKKHQAKPCTICRKKKP